MKKSLNIQGRILDLSVPVVMGILNSTPDSFYGKSRITADSGSVRERAGQMLADGATILDVGGYSTRPGAAFVSEEEEAARVIPVIRMLRSDFPQAILSIDTFRSSVADAALSAGAHIVNDVSGGDLDPKMFDLIASSGAPYILMHMRGTPETMQHQVEYNHPVADVLTDLNKKINRLLDRGVSDIITDPGFGFAKTLDQNYVLLKHLDQFRILGLPVLVGVSRKSMIYKLTGANPEASMNATTALNMFALTKGAAILRVHDVPEAMENIMLFRKLSGGDFF